jgi:hypothetical protein
MSDAELLPDTEPEAQQPVQHIVPPSAEFSEDPPPTNWSAVEAFNEACQLVNDALDCYDKHNSLLVDALIRTARLIEHWRGEHRHEIDAYLGAHAPVDVPATDKRPARPADEVLAIVKCVFHRQSKSQWTWHANALRQAFADGRTSDDMTVYFKDESPTARAVQWRDDRRNEQEATIETALAEAGVPTPAVNVETAVPKYRYQTMHVDKLFNVPRDVAQFEITITALRCKDGGFDLLVPVGSTRSKAKENPPGAGSK